MLRVSRKCQTPVERPTSSCNSSNNSYSERSRTSMAPSQILRMYVRPVSAATVGDVGDGKVRLFSSFSPDGVFPSSFVPPRRLARSPMDRQQQGLAARHDIKLRKLREMQYHDNAVKEYEALRQIPRTAFKAAPSTPIPSDGPDADDYRHFTVETLRPAPIFPTHTVPKLRHEGRPATAHGAATAGRIWVVSPLATSRPTTPSQSGSVSPVTPVLMAPRCRSAAPPTASHINEVLRCRVFSGLGRLPPPETDRPLRAFVL